MSFGPRMFGFLLMLLSNPPAPSVRANYLDGLQLELGLQPRIQLASRESHLPVVRLVPGTDVGQWLAGGFL